MPLFLSLDAGTTSLKAALFNENGSLLAIDRQEYTLDTPHPEWVELDPEIYWRACSSALHAVLAAHAAATGCATSSITPNAIAISSQGETLICLDASQQPTRKAIVWLDNRAAAEAQQIAQRFGPDAVYAATGQPEITPTWPACKILWLKNHEPDVFLHTAKFLLLEDYLLFRLSGSFASDFALHTSSLLLDIHHRRWWDEMLAFLELDPSRLPALLPSGAPAGELQASAASTLGLSPSAHPLVLTGGMDQVLGAIGAGNFTPGVVSEATGGALGIVASLETPAFDPLRRIPCHCHASSAPFASYCLLPWGQTAGMALKWFRDQFYPLEAAACQREGRDPYDLLTSAAAQVPPGCEGLVALPHLEGAACPEFNPLARAVFFGASLRHTRAHFTRSLLEAVAFMLRRNLELVENLGLPIHEVRSMGGGARSSLWLQIKADVLQKPVTRLATEESALLGAALLCAVATQVYPDLQQAAAGMVRLAGRIEPDPANAAVYEQAYQRYLQLYQTLEPLFNSPTP